MTDLDEVELLDKSSQQFNEDVVRLLREFKDYAIVILDKSGKVISWNYGAKCLFGFSGDEVKQKHFSIFYTNEEIEKNLPEINLRKAKENKRYEYEGCKIRKDKTTFYANTVITALHNEDKSIKGFAKITRDITVQKKLADENKILRDELEEKVKQRTSELLIVNKELEAFSYSVSHDLRTPLRAISGYSIMLKEDYHTALDSEGRRIIDVIVDNTKMMGNLIDDLLTFSKLARLEVVSLGIDMKQFAQRCITEMMQIKQEIKYSITIHDIPECKGDANMLKQVWCNLIGNALKYSSKKANPEIEIGGTTNDKFSVYYVKDNGTGFDMKYANKLFGVFQRLHRKDEFEGTGLGLALAQRIVSKHGGEIWAEAALNKGATFYFSIPNNLV